MVTFMVTFVDPVVATPVTLFQGWQSGSNILRYCGSVAYGPNILTMFIQIRNLTEPTIL